MLEYEAPHQVNSLAFKNGDPNDLVLAVGSLKMQKSNKVEILKLKESSP